MTCTECGITSDIIDKPSFACYSESPAYRARLEGTSKTDSGLPISLIEEWVSGRASVIVTGDLMKVDSECSVDILSLRVPTTEPISIPTTAAIIGGVVTVTLIITLVTVAKIIVKMCLQTKKRSELCFSVHSVYLNGASFTPAVKLYVCNTYEAVSIIFPPYTYYCAEIW